MKERIPLTTPHQAVDVSVSAFRPSYAYFHEDGITMYFEPIFLAPLRVAYPGPGVEETSDKVVMSPAAENRLRAALSEVLDLCKERLENPYVPQPQPATGSQKNGNGGNK